jgi:hypothetical protein
MIFLKFLFLGNFLFLSFYAFVLIRYYYVASKLFILSGLLFFKFLLRLITFNIFLYLIFNIGITPTISSYKQIKEIVTVHTNYKLNDINDTQINSVINIVQNGDRDFLYSLSVFNPLSDSLGVIIPLTTQKIFLTHIKHIEFKKSRPILFFKYIPHNVMKLKLTGDELFFKSKNELVELEPTSDSFFTIGENWYSINQISLYLLILLLFLIVGDMYLKFQVLK